MKKVNEEYLNNLRHSCAHLLAAAVMELWPDTKRTIGPTIENGFYYDFDFGEVKISEKDFSKIEQKMHELVKTWKEFKREEVSCDEAVKKFQSNEYKKELIEEFSKEGQLLTLYQSGNYIDLCKGGHCDHPETELKHFKLLSVAGAYWRGNEKKKMLTRIYGTAFASKEELEKYLWQIEEAKKRDHRKLGKELGLFLLSEEIGPGLLIWTPKGATIRREIEKFIVEEQIKRGYQHVYSPHIGKKSLWVTSGHWDLYRDKMYSPMKIDEEDYLVKPMNCPMHMMVYKSQMRSYRDLPIRIAEDATVYRYEKAGELSGMTRVRYITQDDSHIFLREDQVIDEFLGVLDYTIFLMKSFDIKDYYFRLSLRDPKNKEKYLGNDEVWKEAENKIETAVKKSEQKYVRAEGEAAFYGPKLDVMIKDALGREWQCGTIQVDFMLPERFKLEYADKDGKIKRPALIHRAPLGSLERWVGLLIEHYAGAFPVWLSPAQVVIIPISEKYLEYAQKVKDTLLLRSIRVEIDDGNETMQGKIRKATLQKTPYMIILGEREQKNNNLSVRTRKGQDLRDLEIEKFTDQIVREIRSKSFTV